jgi:hypothetical protein
MKLSSSVLTVDVDGDPQERGKSRPDRSSGSSGDRHDGDQCRADQPAIRHHGSTGRRDRTDDQLPLATDIDQPRTCGDHDGQSGEDHRTGLDDRLLHGGRRHHRVRPGVGEHRYRVRADDQEQHAEQEQCGEDRADPPPYGSGDVLHTLSCWRGLVAKARRHLDGGRHAAPPSISLPIDRRSAVSPSTIPVT